MLYSGACRDLTPEQRAAKTRRPAWRVRVPDIAVSFRDGVCGPQTERLAETCGDFIVRRSDGVYAYQLAVVCDDALGSVTEVVRGSDLLGSTARQLWLFSVFGYPAPQYYHVPLLVAPDGRRLSKRERDLDMEALRARCTPEQLVGRLAQLAGLQPGAGAGPRRRPRLPLLMGAHSARRDRDPGKFFGRISCFSLKNSRIVL